ncbi:MAG: Nif3-like dinuclear metal center hexameric protein [Chloroherpetonaceae bacterium]|nr:Nif3-like dinuclear metal center hexameric protein [Chthonomonadaceae bacterium]MDW8209361.1 Nif3-like dinuclear metal center hexameric protein [Chloroherpetonaceae bacterium]
MTGPHAEQRARQGVTIAEVVELLEYLAPPSLAPHDMPSGLQVGTLQEAVETIVISPMPTRRAALRAAENRAALLITGMPLLCTPLNALRWDDPIGERIAYLTQHRISLYALSSAFTTAPGGFDTNLAERLGLAATSVLVPAAAEAQVKFVVFVPLDAVDRVQRAACEAGAGVIGRYSHCAFRCPGTGTFLPEAGAHPTIGTVGQLEMVEEIRLEMLVPEREIKGVIAAVLEAHPYEEVAYDVYPLRNPGMVYGRGRIGELPLHVSLDTVLAQVHDALGLDEDNRARVSHRPDRPIGTLAVASGGDASEHLLYVAHRQGADALVIGSASPADHVLADGLDTVLIEVGFAASIAPGLQRLASQLQDTFGPDGVKVLYIS